MAADLDSTAATASDRTPREAEGSEATEAASHCNKRPPPAKLLWHLKFNFVDVLITRE